MATLAALRQRVLDNLTSAQPQARSPLAQLDGAITSGATTLTITSDFTGTLNAGDILEFADGEQVYVVSVAALVATIVRGFNGTTAAAHSDADFVKINPPHSVKQVDDALNEALRDMTAQGLYQHAAGTDITLVAGTDLYELTQTDAVTPPGVLAVFYQMDTNADLVGLPFLQFEDKESGELTGNLGIRLIHWGDNGAGDLLSVLYAQSLEGKIDGGLTDPILEDIAVLYATGRLLMAMEGSRIHDPGRYTDRTVQPGQSLRDGGFFLGQYQRAVWRAKARLQVRESHLPGREYRRARNFRR